MDGNSSSSLLGKTEVVNREDSCGSEKNKKDDINDK